MNYQPLDTQVKPTKHVTMPAVKRQIWDFVRKGRRYHRIARSYRIDKAEVEQIVTEGLRELESNGAKGPTFRSFETRDGFGKPMRREIIAMPVRVEGRAA